jgi:hypothetical protein
MLHQLLEAIYWNKIDTVKRILKENIDLNMEHVSTPTLDDYLYNPLENIPLHWALYFSRIEIVHVLLQHGADPTYMGSHGNTPIDALLRTYELEYVQQTHRQKQLLEILLCHGAILYPETIKKYRQSSDEKMTAGMLSTIEYINYRNLLNFYETTYISKIVLDKNQNNMIHYALLCKQPFKRIAQIIKNFREEHIYLLLFRQNNDKKTPFDLLEAIIVDKDLIQYSLKTHIEVYKMNQAETAAALPDSKSFSSFDTVVYSQKKHRNS